MSKFPPPPVTTIDWTDPEKFKFSEANGHIESTYHKATGQWTPLTFVADSHLRIHGLAPGLNYGQQAFEGLKASRLPGDDGGIAIFRPEAHAARLQHSSAVLNMPLVPVDMFVEACHAAVALNADYVPPHERGWSLYCRPLLFGSGRSLSPSPADEYTFCVYVFPMPAAPPVSIKALVLDEFERATPKGTGTAKAGGNYAGVFRWSSLAKTEGFGITLHLDSSRHEYVDEFSLCGFLGVKYTPRYANRPVDTSWQNGEVNGEVKDVVTLVVPDSPCALESLTSDSIQQIARHWGWTVEKRPVHYTELPEFSEVIGTGTAVGLAAIRSITRRGRSGAERLPTGPRVLLEPDDGTETIKYIPDEEPGGGIAFKKLLAYFRAIQRGTVHDEFGWLSEVQAKDKELVSIANGA